MTSLRHGSGFASRLWPGLLCLVLFSISLQASAQNLIANPGFENNPPASNGNNIGHGVAPWILGPGNSSNVVKVDGPGGFDYADSGPQSDASNNGAGAGAGVQQHYLDIAAGANDFYQAFQVPVCGATPGQTRQVNFSGWFSTRDNLSGGGGIRIRDGAGLNGTILATVNVNLAAPAHSGTAPWVLASGTVTVQAGSTISYVVSMDNNLNFDEASLSFTGTQCVTAPLTLRKTWVRAQLNDRAVLTATRGGSVVDSLTSIANSANETDADATPLTVFQGESTTLAESLPGTNSGTYASVLACSGGGSTLSGNVLTIGTSGTPITCTWTNSGPITANLAITKTNTPGVNGNIDQSADTVAKGLATTYTIVATNNGPGAADGAVLRDPASTGLTACSATCAVTSGTATCPAETGAALLTALQSTAGAVIPSLAANSSITVTLACTVQ